MQTLVESTLEILSHVMCFLVPLPAQEHPTLIQVKR